MQVLRRTLFSHCFLDIHNLLPASGRCLHRVALPIYNSCYCLIPVYTQRKRHFTHGKLTASGRPTRPRDLPRLSNSPILRSLNHAPINASAFRNCTKKTSNLMFKVTNAMSHERWNGVLQLETSSQRYSLPNLK